MYRDRSSQKNFRLIVITHDMEFVDVLGQAGYTEHYFKVSKEVGYSSTLTITLVCVICCYYISLQGNLSYQETAIVRHGALVAVSIINNKLYKPKHHMKYICCLHKI